MTENLFLKLEEKMMTLLSELESLRANMQRLKEENLFLKSEKERYLMEKSNHEKKLQELISLFDAVNVIEEVIDASDIAA